MNDFNLNDLWSLVQKDLASAMIQAQDRHILDTILGGLRPIVKYEPTYPSGYKVICHTTVVDWLFETYPNYNGWIIPENGNPGEVHVSDELMEILLLKFR